MPMENRARTTWIVAAIGHLTLAADSLTQAQYCLRMANAVIHQPACEHCAESIRKVRDACREIVQFDK